MKTVKQLCKLQPKALSVTVSDQVERLEDLIAKLGDGLKYFEKTYITKGMEQLFREGIRRLAGRSSDAIFHLKQAMGGGKTHLMIAFALLAKSLLLRNKICPDFDGAQDFNTAKIAFFNGYNFNCERYFWGEIAHQLGKDDQFKKFWVNGPQAPDEQDWLKLFEGEGPVLILLDELPVLFDAFLTRQSARGTLAVIAKNAFTTLLTAASKKSNVCVVVSDLEQAYSEATDQINAALSDARQQIARHERNITPVDLAAGDIYEILKKQLFATLPSKEEMQAIASEYEQLLKEASKAHCVNKDALSISHDILETYPFHPRTKQLFALFKNNPNFRQTRGLIELTSRLLRSVWERESDDVYLIGPQHFDLSIQEVRDKISDISGMREVIARDLWDSQSSAHVQLIAQSEGVDASEVGSVILLSSLSVANNAVKGLTQKEIVEFLLAPNRPVELIRKGIEGLHQRAWYLHQTDGRIFFDRNQNLTQIIATHAENAPDNIINAIIHDRIHDIFKPIRKAAYQRLFVFPKPEELTEAIKKERILWIAAPDSTLPSVIVTKYFQDVRQKNNLCILAGDQPKTSNLRETAKMLHGARKADEILPTSAPQREELKGKLEQYEFALTATIASMYDSLLIPRCTDDKGQHLRRIPFTLQATTNGEQQIEHALSENSASKLYLDLLTAYDTLRTKAESVLWPSHQDDIRYPELIERYAEQTGMPWLPPDGINKLTEMACARGHWEELTNGSITKMPRPKIPTLQIVQENGANDVGEVRLRVNILNRTPTTAIQFAQNAEIANDSPILPNSVFVTRSVFTTFRIVDPAYPNVPFETHRWTNELKIRWELVPKGTSRIAKLSVAPEAEILYSINGTDPRKGQIYTQPIELGDEALTILAIARVNGIESKDIAKFNVPKSQEQTPLPDGPVIYTPHVNRPLDSRTRIYDALRFAKERQAMFEEVILTLGDTDQHVIFTHNGTPITGSALESLLENLPQYLNLKATATLHLEYKAIHFLHGQDLILFAERLHLPITPQDYQS